MSTSAAAPIGLLGGSFDPVHAGHLQLARDAQKALGLAELVFVPAGRPWQKGVITPAADRVRMLELAVHAKPHWRIDTRETERSGPSYTVDTLKQFRAESGPQQSLVWILGFDQLRQLATWHRWQELTDLAHLAFARRCGTPDDLEPAMSRYIAQRLGTVADLRRCAAGTLVEFPMLPVDCSATGIRRWLAAGDHAQASRFLTAPVLDYIRTHRLYTPFHGK